MLKPLVVLRALGLGDFLVAVPAFTALQRMFPNSRRILLAPSALGDLAVATGHFSEVVDTGSLRELGNGTRGPDWRMVTRAVIDQPTPSHRINLHGRGPESTRAMLAGSTDRVICYRNAAVAESLFGPEWLEQVHERERWCRLLRHFGVAADEDEYRLSRSHFPAVSPSPSTWILHPGASNEAKRWPAERFVELAVALIRSGKKILLTGSSGEAHLAYWIADRAGLTNREVVAGRTSILELAALVASVQGVVCGDTGVGHLATAFGTSSVVLFEDDKAAAVWGPPTDRGRHFCLTPELPERFLQTTPRTGMAAINVDDVMRAITKVH